MAQKRQHNPGDAANAFIRVLLSDAGRLAGGLSDSEWEDTLKYFDHRCAYTGDQLTKENRQQEHAIPINRKHCGLHLYGNVVPATKAANSRKHSRHYKDFLRDDKDKDKDRLHRIERFMEDTRYRERTKPFEHIQRFCQTQYELITALCDVNKRYLKKLMPEGSAHEDASGDPASGGRQVGATGPETDRKPTARVHDEIIRLLMIETDGVGLSYREIADMVRERVPSARTTHRSVACYKQYAKNRTRGITEAQAKNILSIRRPRSH